MDDQKQPLLTLKPHFDDALTMVQAGLFTLVAIPVTTVLGGGFLLILLWLLGLSRFVASGYVLGLVFVATIVVLPPVFYEVKKAAYMRSFFRFYADHLEYRFLKFFLMERTGRVAYEDIADITTRSSALQEQRRLFSVLLHVPSMRVNQHPFAGIAIEDLQKTRNENDAVIDIVASSNRRAEDAERRVAAEQQQAAIRQAAAEMIAEAARLQQQAATEAAGDKTNV
jgi:hypothetical protein